MTRTIQNGNRMNRNRMLPSKEFLPRESLLTELIATGQMRTIRNVYVTTVIILFLNCFVYDFVGTGQINLGLNPIIQGFKGIQFGLLIWLAMQTTSILVLPMFILWSGIRRQHFSSKGVTRLFDYLSVLAIVGYILTFGYCSTGSVLKVPGLAVRLGLFLEMTRLLMKTYAFVRSNAARAKKPKTELPSFKHYIYFMFCPTMVYRDSYPRNELIRWNFVIKNLIGFFGAIFCMSFVFDRYVIPVFQDTGATQISSSEFALKIFNAMVPAMLIVVSFFYMLLHAWMNAAAEMLRFADRQFYTDWWNADSFPEYYRKWNIVVHDWLFTYVYKDAYENLFRDKKVVAMLMVFTMSSLVHEYILAFLFGFVYPVMFVLFQGLGVVMMFFPNKNRRSFGNAFMWFGLITGNALMCCLYNMEFQARRNCPVGDSIVDYFVPVSWTCNGITTNSDWKIHF